mmetsp:Transcript_11694/g.20063  ORF Transcript_11694/g.20063 Transcript_11694/m.20063 type:complete len:175 (+) Transcript_11694:447-971(+)
MGELQLIMASSNLRDLQGSKELPSSAFEEFDEQVIDELLKVLSSSEGSPQIDSRHTSNHAETHLFPPSVGSSTPQSKSEQLECEHCGATFGRKYDVARHIQSVHKLNLEEEFRCDSCPKTFRRKDGLILHTNRVHKNARVPCRLCTKRFVSETRLHTHLKNVHKIDLAGKGPKL